MSKKPRPSVPNPLVAAKEQYYKRKTELVEEEFRKKKREEEFELDVVRRAQHSYFIDACVVNSYIIYTSLDLPKVTMKDFRRSICNALLSNTPTKKRKTMVCIANHKPHVPVNIRYKNADHQPVMGTRRRCALCSTKTYQVRTKWQCTTCNVPLCLRTKNCFSLYHRSKFDIANIVLSVMVVPPSKYKNK
jgi:hypothetical protein